MSAPGEIVIEGVRYQLPPLYMEKPPHPNEGQLIRFGPLQEWMVFLRATGWVRLLEPYQCSCCGKPIGPPTCFTCEEECTDERDGR